jgi:putative transposase
VREGISKPSIWGGIQAQALLGNEEFVEKLKGYVKGYEEVSEIPRNQRYLSRPKLKALFDGKLTKGKRDARIVQAVHRYGYSQREVAEFLNLHYATVSRLANRL